MKIARTNKLHSKAVLSLVVYIMIFIPVIGIFVGDSVGIYRKIGNKAFEIFTAYSMIILPIIYLFILFYGGYYVGNKV